MQTEIESIRHNPLMERNEVTVRIDHRGEPTPSMDEVKDRVSAEEDFDPEEVEVISVKGGYGSNSSIATLKVFEELDLDQYEDVEEKGVESEEPETEVESSSEDEYEEIVSGTIGEAKDALKDMESPDFDKALEAEKSNKNRTTLVDWLESQKE